MPHGHAVQPCPAPLFHSTVHQLFCPEVSHFSLQRSVSSWKSWSRCMPRQVSIWPMWCLVHSAKCGAIWAALFFSKGLSTVVMPTPDRASGASATALPLRSGSSQGLKSANLWGFPLARSCSRKYAIWVQDLCPSLLFSPDLEGPNAPGQLRLTNAWMW